MKPAAAARTTVRAIRPAAAILLTAAAAVALGFAVRSYFVIDRIDDSARPSIPEVRAWAVLSYHGVFRVIRSTTEFVVVEPSDPDMLPHYGWTSPPSRTYRATPVDARTRESLHARAPTRWFGLLGFGVRHSADRQPLPYDAKEAAIVHRAIIVDVPYWFVVACLGAYPALRFGAWRRTRRQRARGLCLRCGYDLRESNDRCPECGTPVPPPPRA